MLKFLIFSLFIFSLFSCLNTAQAKISCIECKATFAAIIPLLGKNSTAQNLLNTLESECEKLPSSTEKYCDELAQWVVSELPEVEKEFERYEPIGLCSILGICKVDCCQSKKHVEQVKLAFASDDSFSVSWIAAEKVPLSQTQVQYQLVAGGAVQTTSASSVRTYTQGGWEGYIYVAEMSSLKVGRARYQYRITNDKNDNSMWSNYFTFATGPANPSQSTNTIGFIADMGTINSADTIANLKRLTADHTLDFIIHAGDISYADAYQHTWDVFCRSIEPITASVAYMTCPGNHEIPWRFVSYRNRFGSIMPYTLSNSTDPLYYSFNYGPVHYISADTELLVDEGWIGDTQKAWLEADLASVDRSVTPWIVFFAHRPTYCAMGGIDCGADMLLIRSRLEPMFHRYGVDLSLTGHKHSYERTLPVYQDKPTQTNYVNPKATTYVVAGTAGNNEGIQHSYHPPASGWSVKHLTEFGYATITVNATQLSWNFYTEDNTVADTFTITKPN